MLREWGAAFAQSVWARPDRMRTWLVGLLKPLSGAYGAIQWIRRALYRRGVLRQRRLPCGVISVGALRVGGSGKTPFVLWCTRRLAEKGFRPAILTRGYRRRSSVTPQILLHDQIERLDPVETGDEPYLLARSLPGVPVVVDPDRYRGACAILDRRPVDVFVLDDGFQHLRLARDCDIVLIGSEPEELAALCLPAGPLREPPGALQYAQALVRFSGAGPFPDSEGSRTFEASCSMSTPPLFSAEIRPIGFFTLDGQGPLDASFLREKEVLAFCGIGRPESFWLTLERMGIQVALRESFPDHHRYAWKDFRRILGRLGASQWAVTTEKDAVKIAHFPWPSGRMLFLRIGVQMHEEERFWQILFACLGRPQGGEKSGHR